MIRAFARRTKKRSGKVMMREDDKNKVEAEVEAEVSILRAVVRLD